MTAPHPLIAELTTRQQELGITTTDVSRTTGIARSTINNWRAGRRDPRLYELETYAEALGARLAWQPVDGWTVEEPEPAEQLPYGQLVLDENEKYCAGCDQVRSRRTDFHRDRSKKDGLKPTCKFCCLERRERRAQQAGEAAA